MNKKTSRKQARRLYEKTFGKLPEGWHVHHMDGNPFNNDIWNLLGCSPEKHWAIHEQQGDIRCLNGKFIQGASAAGKLGAAAIKDNHPMKGRKHTKEAVEKNRNSQDSAGEKNPMFGKKCTEFMNEQDIKSWKYNISKGLKGNSHACKGEVITPGHTYKNITEASNRLKIRRQDILKKINNPEEKEWIRTEKTIL